MQNAKGQGQANYWKLGGNDNNPPSAVNSSNNIFGTNINVPINFFTNGIQRMHINGDVPGTEGFI